MYTISKLVTHHSVARFVLVSLAVLAWFFAVTPLLAQAAPLAHYPLDGSVSDVTGNGHDGTAEGVITYDEGVHGQSAYFDGQSLVRIAHPFSTATTDSAMSLSFWMKTDTEKEAIGVISQYTACQYGDNDHFHMSLYNYAPGGEFALRINRRGNTELRVERAEVVDNEWHHIAATFGALGEVSEYYVDGVLVDTGLQKTALAYNPAIDLVLGGYHVDNCPQEGHYVGYMDDVRIYDYALSEAEIAVLSRDPAANQAPVLSPIGDQMVSENETLTIELSATDPEGDAITYSVANAPVGATFDGTTFTWTPDYSQAGNYPNIEFTAADDQTPMALDVELITITVGDVNRAPSMTSPGSQSVLEEELVTFDVTAVDPDGDAVVITASSTPAGATFDGTTFTWIPSLQQAGVYTVFFTATDDGLPAESATIGVVITVGDNPTPVEQSEQLVEEVVTNPDLPNNVVNSYLSNLKKVSQFIEQGQVNAAANQLDSFVHKVEQDYLAGSIDEATRDIYVSLAQNLLADLQNL